MSQNKNTIGQDGYDKLKSLNEQKQNLLKARKQKEFDNQLRKKEKELQDTQHKKEKEEKRVLKRNIRNLNRDIRKMKLIYKMSDSFFSIFYYVNGLLAMAALLLVLILCGLFDNLDFPWYIYVLTIIWLIGLLFRLIINASVVPSRDNYTLSEIEIRVGLRLILYTTILLVASFVIVGLLFENYKELSVIL